MARINLLANARMADEDEQNALEVKPYRARSRRSILCPPRGCAFNLPTSASLDDVPQSHV